MRAETRKRTLMKLYYADSTAGTGVDAGHLNDLGARAAAMELIRVVARAGS